MSSSFLFSKSILKSSFKTIPINNRIVIAPMCQYSCNNNNGEANDWHLMHWGNLLNSGAGLVILEATGVNPEGRITPKCLGLWNQQTQDALEENLKRARKLAPKIPVFIQLSHAGRKGSTMVPWEGGNILPIENGGWRTYAPSALSFHNSITSSNCIPISMTENDLLKVKFDFVEAAKRAQAIGLEGIEIHSAHGYLLHEFLSPLSNHRTDRYGGSLENRIRYPLEVFQAIRSVYDGILGVRLSATDWVENGWDLTQSLEYIHQLVQNGCDYLHISSGGLSSQQKIPIFPGYQVQFAEKVKELFPSIPVITVGLITDPHQAEAILQKKQADYIALARGVLYKPRWGWEAAVALGGSVEAKGQYARCLPLGTPSKTFSHEK